MFDRLHAGGGAWLPAGTAFQAQSRNPWSKEPHNSPHLPSTWGVRVLVLMLVGASLVWAIGRQVGATPTTYYVDCSSGSDSNSGTSTSAAWRNITHANGVSLKPGDSLLLKRGCVWSQQLRAHWAGTSTSDIYIGAYGSGDKPKLQNSTDGNVRISGSYLTIENLQTYNSPGSYGSYDANCTSQPVGWVVGFNFVSAHHVTVRNSLATHEAIGVGFNSTAHDNHVLNNQIINNDGAWQPISKGLRGGTGVLLEGTNNEIGFNHFEGNSTMCNAESISVELYTASSSRVHHNTTYGDKVFLEAGSTSTFQSSNNTIAYNAFTTGMGNSRFVVTRGVGASFGPVYNTSVYDNDVYLTASNSQGVVCSSCGNNILRLENNNIVVGWKAVYVGGGQPIESHNTYWSPSGQPTNFDFLQNLTVSSSSHIQSPRFVDPGNKNFHLQSSSPSINAGSMDSVNAGYKSDLDGTSVPQSGAVDVGSYEYVGSSSSTSSGSTAIAVPGRIQAENYNNGGEGVGYHDTTAGNAGGAYRKDNVDIETCTDSTTASGQTCYDVGWADNGEWLAYSVSASTSGTYKITARVASLYGGTHIHFLLDGNNVTGSIAIPNTGGWQHWTLVTSPSFSLSAGSHTIKLVDEGDHVNVNYFDIGS